MNQESDWKVLGAVGGWHDIQVWIPASNYLVDAVESGSKLSHFPCSNKWEGMRTFEEIRAVIHARVFPTRQEAQWSWGGGRWTGGGVQVATLFLYLLPSPSYARMTATTL